VTHPHKREEDAINRDICLRSAAKALTCKEGHVKLSTRNQLAGTVVSITSGEAMAVVKVQLEGGQSITSAITAESARDLGIAEGSDVVVLIKSTEVAHGVED
jgi:molybdopterin-binding protein